MSEDPSDKVAKGFEALGLNFEDFRQRFAETGDIVGLFQTLKTAGLDTASALAIFGREAGAGAIILANNADKVGELQTALEDSGGAAEAMADRQLVGLPGALELLRSAAEGVVLALGASGLTAILTRAAEIATDFARAISEAPEWVQRLISGALLLGPALLGIAAAAKGLVVRARRAADPHGAGGPDHRGHRGAGARRGPPDQALGQGVGILRTHHREDPRLPRGRA